MQPDEGAGGGHHRRERGNEAGADQPAESVAVAGPDAGPATTPVSNMLSTSFLIIRQMPCLVGVVGAPAA